MVGRKMSCFILLMFVFMAPVLEIAGSLEEEFGFAPAHGERRN